VHLVFWYGKHSRDTTVLNRRATSTPEQREAINASRRERRQLNHLPQLVSSADLRHYTIISMVCNYTSLKQTQRSLLISVNGTAHQ